MCVAYHDFLLCMEHFTFAHAITHTQTHTHTDARNVSYVQYNIESQDRILFIVMLLHIYGMDYMHMWDIIMVVTT